MKEQITTLRKRLMRYFLLVVLIMSVCLGVFYQIAMQNTTRLAVESMENIMGKINLDTYNILHEAEEVAHLVAKDSELQKALRKPLPGTSQELYRQRMDLNAKLWDIKRYTPNIDGIYVVGENGAQYRSAFSSMLQKDFRREEWYQELKKTKSSIWSCFGEGSFIIRDLDSYMISLRYPVIDRASYEFMGAVVLDISMENLRQIAQEGMGFDGTLILLDERNQMLYTDMDKEADLSVLEGVKRWFSEKEIEKSGTATADIGGNGYLISGMALDIAGWKIVGMIPEQVIYEQLNMMKGMLLAVSVICICLSVVLAISVSNGVSRPVRDIRTAMKNMEHGNLEVHVESNRNDEMGALAVSFNHMANELKILVQEQKKAQEKLRRAELKALQAQINPHFLYNTLDSINWMARAGEISQVGEMINSLSIFFRISLSGGKMFITVEEELRHVENYILIQKKRYEKYLDYKIEVPAELYSCSCLKMILQPLVENGIYHGIKEKGQRGMISITAEEKEDMLLFYVTDTGKGMSAEKLKELEQMMKKGIEYDSSSYGVINVQQRIQTCYGEQYGLHFQSKIGEGTQVTVVLPKHQCVQGGNTNELESSDCRG